MNEYFLYKKNGSEEQNPSYYNVCFHELKKGLFIPGEEKSIRLAINRLYFLVISRNKGRIAYVINDEKDHRIIHTSYILPKSYKFPFMNNNDYEIGPCFTNADYRGRGIYPAVLKSITGESNNAYYMLVEKGNKASIRGIEKSGFIRMGYCRKTRYLKIYDCFYEKTEL